MLPFFFFFLGCNSIFFSAQFRRKHITQKSLTCNSSSQCGTWRLLWATVLLCVGQAVLAQCESGSVRDEGALEQPAPAELGAEL